MDYCSWCKFWTQYPALFYALLALQGAYFFFFPSLLCCIPLTALLYPWIPLKQLRQPILGTLVFLSSAAFVAFLHASPLASGITSIGEGTLRVRSTRVENRFFGGQKIYQCDLLSWNSDRFRSLPCEVRSRDLRTIPLNTEYHVKGKLREKQGKIVLTASHPDRWVAGAPTSSLVEWRMSLHKAVSDWFSERMGAKPGRFMFALVTGQSDLPDVQEQMGSLGLLHLLAISGFHFTLITSFLRRFFSLFLTCKHAEACIILTSTCYVCLLGPSPSILRGWIMCSANGAATILDKKHHPLNALGVAIIATLLYDPWFARAPGFVLSFCITAAILIFGASTNEFFAIIFQRRKSSACEQMPWWECVGCVLSALCRTSLAIGVAVNLVALPLTLYYFHKFPLMGLFYNLFYPPLVGIALFLCCLGCCCGWCPPLAHAVHHWNGAYVQQLLDLLAISPKDVPLSLEAESVPTYAVALWLMVLFAYGVQRTFVKNASFEADPKSADKNLQIAPR